MSKVAIKMTDDEIMRVFGYSRAHENIYRTKIGFIGVVNKTTGYSGAWGGNVTNECLIVGNYKKYKDGNITLDSPEAKKDVLKRWTGNSVPKNLEKQVNKLVKENMKE